MPSPLSKSGAGIVLVKSSAKVPSLVTMSRLSRSNESCIWLFIWVRKKTKPIIYLFSPPDLPSFRNKILENSRSPSNEIHLWYIFWRYFVFYYVQAYKAKFRMISDIDLSDGWEGPIWISKSDRAKMPNFEYVASNGRGQITVYSCMYKLYTNWIAHR